MKRPNLGANEGKSPALGDEEVKAILEAPAPNSLKGLRDRAILSTLLFHGLRRSEVGSLTVGDIQSRRCVMHFKIHGKGGKIRFVPVHPHSMQRISEYLDRSGHGEAVSSPLFRPVKNSLGSLEGFLTGHGIYVNVTRSAVEDRSPWRVGGLSFRVCPPGGRRPKLWVSGTHSPSRPSAACA